MDYLIFSDSHGDYITMLKIIEKRHPKGVIFLGDCVRDIEKVKVTVPNIDYKIIRGNNDYYVNYPDEEIIFLSDTRIFLCHGHKQRVKLGNTYITDYCIKKHCDMVFFGHTHKPLCEYNNGVLLFNPGSIGYPYMGEKTYGILSLNKGENGVKTSIQTIKD